jgi:anthranilate synthase component 1
VIRNKPVPRYPFKASLAEQSNMTDDYYNSLVDKAKSHCQRGDVFQLVLSRSFSRNFKGDEFNVYRALRSINPSPYLFYFDYGDYKLIGSSPEMQLKTKDQTAVLNPIAGTFKRTGEDAEDKELAEKLLKDKKENSEHVMLVDLARNDLARHTKEVEVARYKEVQFYSHVLHIVSSVTGKMKSPGDVLKILSDTFPAGTLTGAPKYRAMQLIDQYEPDKRGFYGGCIGFINPEGESNHAIMIRTLLSKGNNLFYRAGAGIINESVKENELKEVDHKLAAIRNAIEKAVNIHSKIYQL